MDVHNRVIIVLYLPYCGRFQKSFVLKSLILYSSTSAWTDTAIIAAQQATVNAVFTIVFDFTIFLSVKFIIINY